MSTPALRSIAPESAIFSSFFDQNLAAHQLRPLTRQKVSEAEARGRVRLLSDGTPVLDVNGKLLGHPLSGERVRASIPNDPAGTIVVIFGFGMGHTARAVRSVTDAPIVVYEPDVGLLRTALSYGPSDLGDIVVVSNPYDLTNAWSKFARDQRDAILVKTPGYSEAYADQLKKLAETLRSLISRVTITRNTFTSRGRIWIEDVLRNVEVLEQSPPFLSLAGQFKNVPAFIIGAGPSLDKNIALLQECTRKGIVFATNSSATALEKHGIKPQVLGCIESIDQSEKLKTLELVDYAVRAFSLSAAPETVALGKGPLLPIFESVIQYSRPLEELTQVPAVGVCGSVSTAMFSLACALGCSPIVLIGQDLAYTDGRTYAGGTGYETSTAHVNKEKGVIELNWNDELRKVHGSSVGKRHEKEPVVMMPAWGGDGEVVSGPTFQSVNSWLEGVAATMQDSGSQVRFLNATEGGARINKWEELPLASILRDLPECNITPDSIFALAKSQRKPCTLASLHAWASGHREMTRNLRRCAHRVKRLSRHALSTMKAEHARDVSRAFAALDAAENGLRKAVARSPLVDAWAHAAIEQAMASMPLENPGTDARGEAERGVIRGARVAEAVENSAKELELVLKKLGERLQARSETERNV